MMGRKYREQANFFYEFRLDDMIPKGHLTPWLAGRLALRGGEGCCASG
jgi:hypothetical protein